MASFAAGGATVMLFPPSEPFSSPRLVADLALRVLFALVGNLISLVPMSILYNNGEFAAALFILTVEIRNFQTIIYALLWRDDNMEAWWPGWGLCDMHSFIYNATNALYATCLLAIMRNLAHQVGLLRVNPLTVRERRRKNVIQALIIFPLPIIMLAFTWPLTSQRYIISAVMGCRWVPANAWPLLVFFILAPAAIVVVTAVYTVITFIRFRQVSKSTKSAVTSNRDGQCRQQRTKRRLYLMTCSIFLPYMPIYLGLVICNIIEMLPIESFSYAAIHRLPGTPEATMEPFAWSTPVFIPSTQISWLDMENNWIPIITCVPIFLFFGMTKDAINTYRRVALVFGAGRVWPVLHQEYDPDRSAASRSGSSFTFGTTLVKGSKTSSSANKLSHVASKVSLYKQTTITTTCSSASGGEPTMPPASLTFVTANDLEQGSNTRETKEVDAQAHLSAAAGPSRPAPSATRNPFSSFRTNLNVALPFAWPSSRAKGTAGSSFV